jgi:hypothetical protein
MEVLVLEAVVLEAEAVLLIDLYLQVLEEKHLIKAMLFPLLQD